MSDVDVAALREALGKATPGPWATGMDWAAIGFESDSVIHGYVDTECDCCGEKIKDVAQVAISAADAELIVLLRNNAGALLDALEQAQATITEQSMELAHLTWLGERAAERADAQIAALTCELERAQAASEGVDMLVAQAEQRGAVEALRAAARVPHNGAQEFDGPRGRVHPQSLYNEGASPWLDGIADEIERGADL